MRAGSVIAVFVAGLAIPACFDTDVGDAVLACDADADCPEPLFCDGGRCRRGSAGDTTPPGIVDVTVADRVLKPGSSTTVTFRATEALSETPRFTGFNLLFDSPNEQDGVISVVVAVDRDAAEDTHGITVVLVDVAGNASDDLFVGSIQVDRTPPRLVSSTVPATVAPGGSIGFEAEASEALVSAVCSFDPLVGGIMRVDAEVQDAFFACASPAIDAGASAVEVSAELIDAAGNAATVDVGFVGVGFVP
jgi:hypothetical protein